ncbi:MAG: MgtC/SapB family protein [Gemmatimonadota bacterium]|nr:MgtC/SapB family protein [Gemmatimonadota bacterium]HEU4988170.1 MgtC/SapB family protein [Gemmatimonadaceae bacterium]
MATLFESLQLSLFAKLAMAALLGGAIGLEREIAGKPAGLRTNILICMGAALFMHLSIAVGEIGFSAPDGHPYGDVTRIAAQIVTGVGFIGAGTIMQARGTVIGLTSAATIWMVAAIGSALGAGYYVGALGAGAMVMVVLGGLGWLEQRVRRVRRTASATIRVSPGTPVDEIERVLRGVGVRVITHAVFDHPDDRTFEMKLSGPARQFDEARNHLIVRDDVQSFELE